MHPAIDQQAQWWDQWNAPYQGLAVTPEDRYRSAQAAMAQMYLGPGPTLEVGCGVGWLARTIYTPERPVVGVDLSEVAIAYANQDRRPDLTFRAGDFVTMPFTERFMNVVTADCLAHVADQQAFVDRVASLLMPHGTFLLMTQNPFVWSRSSYLQPQGVGQLRHWASLVEIRTLLANNFTIEYITGIMAGGDQGILRLVNSRLVRWPIAVLMGRTLQRRLYDHYIGRELVVVARRRK